MIPVIPQPEPERFEDEVRSPGLRFLSSKPKISTKAWSKHNYWRRIFPELYSSYRGICAYSCHWIPRDAGGSIDHFLPKSLYINLAYEWSNFRLASIIYNARKRDHEDVLDPFEVEYGWFVIDFPSLFVKADANLESPTLDQVNASIQRLDLNCEYAIETRWDFLKPYCYDQISFKHLRETAPFISAELERQNLVNSIQDIMLPQP